MSDLKNKTTEDRTEFEQKTTWVAFSGIFVDVSNNRWRIDVSGNEEAVSAFVENKPYSLVVRPLTKEEVTPPRPPTKKVRPEMGQKVPGMPALDVTFALEDLAENLKPPYQVIFEVDPCMKDKYDSYTFYLKGNDTTPNVSYTADGGTICVQLYCKHKSTTSTGSGGNVNLPTVPQESWCHIAVHKQTGEPCYTLRGDITVN